MMRLRRGKLGGSAGVPSAYSRQDQAASRDAPGQRPVACRVDRSGPVPTTAMVLAAVPGRPRGRRRRCRWPGRRRWSSPAFAPAGSESPRVVQALRRGLRLPTMASIGCQQVAHAVGVQQPAAGRRSAAGGRVAGSPSATGRHRSRRRRARPAWPQAGVVASAGARHASAVGLRSTTSARRRAPPAPRARPRRCRRRRAAAVPSRPSPSQRISRSQAAHASRRIAGGCEPWRPRARPSGLGEAVAGAHRLLHDRISA
jgi:hypothetical protein